MCLRACVAFVALGRLLLQLGNLAAELYVFGEVAQVACHGFTVAFQGVLVLAHTRCDAHDRLIRLELRERGLQNLAGALSAVGGNEVRRHVVGGAERGVQRVGAG